MDFGKIEMILLVGVVLLCTLGSIAATEVNLEHQANGDLLLHNEINYSFHDLDVCISNLSNYLSYHGQSDGHDAGDVHKF